MTVKELTRVSVGRAVKGRAADGKLPLDLGKKGVYIFYTRELSIMVFFMVLTLATTRKPAPLLAFPGLFAIEWE